MRTLLLFLALVCTAGMALAADVTGTWKGEVTTPDGDKMELQYKFIQEGAKLTGSAVSPHGETLDIADGKVEGDTLAFTVEVKMNGGMKVSQSGKITGEAIDLEIHFGDNPPMKVKLTRAIN